MHIMTYFATIAVRTIIISIFYNVKKNLRGNIMILFSSNFAVYS